MIDVKDRTKPQLIKHHNWSPPFGGGTHNCLPLPDRDLLVVADEAVLDNCEDGIKYIWMFDINTARENQPLETPKLFSTLEGYLRRNEISDPPQMLPFLRELINDERMPLMARNHAARLIKQIEKSK